MKKYKNISGSSGIIAYDIDAAWIKVKFIPGPVYKYSYSKPGKQHVEKMKKLAKEGSELATYISKYVRDAYESCEN